MENLQYTYSNIDDLYDHVIASVDDLHSVKLKDELSPIHRLCLENAYPRDVLLLEENSEPRLLFDWLVEPHRLNFIDWRLCPVPPGVGGGLSSVML